MKSKPTPEIYFQVSQSWVSKNTGTPQIKKKCFYTFFSVSVKFFTLWKTVIKSVITFFRSFNMRKIVQQNVYGEAKLQVKRPG